MKSNLSKAFKTDRDLEVNGVWLEVQDGVRFLVSRFNEMNPKTKAAFARHYAPYAAAIEAQAMPEEREREILVKVFVESSLRNWEGVEIDDEAVPFSPEKAVELLMELPDLFATLYKYAKESGSYKPALGN